MDSNSDESHLRLVPYAMPSRRRNEYRFDIWAAAVGIPIVFLTCMLAFFSIPPKHDTEKPWAMAFVVDRCLGTEDVTFKPTSKCPALIRSSLSMLNEAIEGYLHVSKLPPDERLVKEAEMHKAFISAKDSAIKKDIDSEREVRTGDGNLDREECLSLKEVATALAMDEGEVLQRINRLRA
ncbi:uncharacterized protein LOC100899434 [Galendromus occidentalis]|uniref:Uncharacterized protein LOC100899434 n=1 Tax=Galendromus occidentalis TaxID=34638 RepID=A0AAJ6VZW8_9ACAR|nr:uncharacterized protein LOC100899434 [Galendromus occidentalis]